MTVTALVTVGGVEQSSGTLFAVVGTEVRGVQDTPSTPPFGPYFGRPLFQITIYADDAGETVGFVFLGGSSGGVVTMAETLTFQINGNVG